MSQIPESNDGTNPEHDRKPSIPKLTKIVSLLNVIYTHDLSGSPEDPQAKEIAKAHSKLQTALNVNMPNLEGRRVFDYGDYLDPFYQYIRRDLPNNQILNIYASTSLLKAFDGEVNARLKKEDLEKEYEIESSHAERGNGSGRDVIFDTLFEYLGRSLDLKSKKEILNKVLAESETETHLVNWARICVEKITRAETFFNDPTNSA